MPNLNDIADNVITAVKGYVERKCAALVERLNALDAAVKAIPAGKDGAQGAQGKDGAAGPAGERGEKGDTGPAGKDGAAGAAGERGEKGEAGQVGPAGERGEKGDAGLAGELGAAGAAGEKGLPGDPGARGERGEKGEAGAGGERGGQGPAGEKGPGGAAGERGEKGEKGLDGKDGRDGREGKDGAAGRDALELDLLPSIDEGKSYPRGTWASHNGGLMRATRTTDALKDKIPSEAGWMVAVEGVAAVVVTQGEDPRKVVVSTVLTSGKSIAVDFAVPAVIYRGIHKDGGEYEPGDMVTWAGSTWHRDVAGKGRPGDADSGWTLCVKKGRDGRDKA